MDFNSIIETSKPNEKLEKFKVKKEKFKHIIDCIEKLEYDDLKEKLISFLSMTEGKFLILSLKYDKIQDGYKIPSILEYSFIRKGKFPEVKKLIINKIGQKILSYENKNTSHYYTNIIKNYKSDRSIVENEISTIEDFNRMLWEEKLNETTSDLIVELFLEEIYKVEGKPTDLKMNFKTDTNFKPENYIINNEVLNDSPIFKEEFENIFEYSLEENHLLLKHYSSNVAYENLEDIIPYILSIIFLEQMFDLYNYIVETDFNGYDDQYVSLILSYNENNSSLNYQFIAD